MKHRMLTRRTLGKISTYLRSIKGRSKGSDTRRNIRNPNNIPNSNKVGAGTEPFGKVIRNFIFSPSMQKRKRKEKANNLKHKSKV